MYLLFYCTIYTWVIARYVFLVINTNNDIIIVVFILIVFIVVIVIITAWQLVAKKC